MANRSTLEALFPAPGGLLTAPLWHLVGTPEHSHGSSWGLSSLVAQTTTL